MFHSWTSAFLSVVFSSAPRVSRQRRKRKFTVAAGVQYGPCYHLACDTFENVSLDALDQMSNAAAHAVLTLADTK
jgi:hypothetical protein